MEQKSYPVVGMGYRPADDQIAYNALEEGARLVLEREPDNQFDPFAIKVLIPEDEASGTGYFHVGYIPAKIAAKLAPRLDAGEECTVEHGGNGWVQVAWFGFGGGEPDA
jgi:hypothetical protein